MKLLFASLVATSLLACGGGQTTINSVPESDCRQLIENMVGMIITRVPMSKRSAFEDRFARKAPEQVRKCEAANIPPATMQCALAARSPQAIDACQLK